MSKYKKHTVMIAGKSGITTKDGTRTNFKPKLSLKIIGAGTGGLLIIAALVFTGLKLYSSSSEESSQATPTQHSTVGEDTSARPATVVRQLNEAGKYPEAQAYIAKQVQSSANTNDKVSWYVQAYNAALDAKQYDDAVTFANKAYEILPSSANAYAVSQAYGAKGDTVNRRKYLQLAIDTLDKNKASYQIKKNQYMQELAGLQI